MLVVGEGRLMGPSRSAITVTVFLKVVENLLEISKIGDWRPLR
jgi:hypothetical protein